MIATFSYMTELEKKHYHPRCSQVHATLNPKLNLDMPMVVGFFAFFLGGSWPWVVQ
jgi:hypothetical protein